MPMIIGALVAALMQALRTYGPGIVGRILLALGIGLVAYKAALPGLVAFVQQYINGMPAMLVAYAYACGFLGGVSMIISTWIATSMHKAFVAKLSGD